MDTVWKYVKILKEEIHRFVKKMHRKNLRYNDERKVETLWPTSKIEEKLKEWYLKPLLLSVKRDEEDIQIICKTIQWWWRFKKNSGTELTVSDHLR